MTPLYLWWRALKGTEDSAIRPHEPEAYDLGTQNAPPPQSLIDQLTPLVAGLESLRVTTAATFTFRARLAMVWVLGGLCGVMLGHDALGLSPVYLAAAWALSSAAVLFWATAPYRAWVRQVREDVIQQVLSYLGQGYTLDAYGSVSTDRLRQTGLLFRVDRIIATHQINGQLAQGPLVVSEVRVKARRFGDSEGNRTDRTVFHGLMAVWSGADHPVGTVWQVQDWRGVQQADAVVALGPVPKGWMRPPFLYQPIALTPYVTRLGSFVGSVEAALNALVSSAPQNKNGLNG